MLVVLVIGLLAVTVSLALPDSAQQRLDRDARRLQAQLALALEQAIYRNRDYGVLIAEGGYRFYQREGETWVAVEEPRLGEQPLAEATRLHLEMEGERVQAALLQASDSMAHAEVELSTTVAARSEDKEPLAPQILILSDGQVSPFELTLTHPDAARNARLLANFNGDLRLQTADER